MTNTPELPYQTVILDLRTRPYKQMHIDSLKQETVICLGNFDGVHVAHRDLLLEGTRISHTTLNGGLCGVFCFFKPSADILYPSSSPNHLTTLKSKLELFAESGIDFVCLSHFEALRNLSPHDFLIFLSSNLHCRFIVCGFNYRYGKNGNGTVDTLRSDCNNIYPRIYVSVLQERKLSTNRTHTNEISVSSSNIRELLRNGCVQEAAILLGRPYSLRSRVLNGKKLGRTIGFPTANQSFPVGQLIPRCGVYYVRVSTPDGIFYGISNIGNHPTVDRNAPINCETYLIGYHGNLYDRIIRVEFLSFIRPEQKFDSIDALKSAIQKDMEAIQTLTLPEIKQ